jgi:ferrochelatase
MTGTAIVLIGHGTVEDLDDLPGFLANIRQGHAAPAELVREVRAKYEAIGGRSPLQEICRRIAGKLEAASGLPVEVASRLSSPAPGDVLVELARRGVMRVCAIPLAQHSAHVYGAAMVAARDALAASGGPRIALACAANWGGRADLTNVYTTRIRELTPEDRTGMRVVFTAHSLPMSVLDAGDPYEGEVRAAAANVARILGLRDDEHGVAFQSQGASSGRPVAWLGPDLRGALEAAARAGKTGVIVSPIGFLADHVEILYDLDIEARGWATELGLSFLRARSPNADDDLVAVLRGVAGDLLARDAWS